MKQDSRDSANPPRPHRSSVTSWSASPGAAPSYQHYTAPCGPRVWLGSQLWVLVAVPGWRAGGVVSRGLPRLSCFPAKMVFRTTTRLCWEKRLPRANPHSDWRCPSSGCTGLGRPARAHHAGTAWGVFTQTSILREKSKGASALYCVYIKVLYVFITLIIVIKSLPFLICGLGKFCLFFLFGGFVCCLFFWAKNAF